MNQNYTQYTATDFEVWNQLFERQNQLLADKGARKFLRGIELAGFEAGKIPEFTELNERLQALTGWTIIGTDGLVENALFFGMLSNKQFPAATWIRPMDSLDYIEAPDLFHDVYGHVPMLSDPDFCKGLSRLGELGLKWQNNAEVVEILARFYWFTAEFGMLWENDALKIYGAGILSSYGESNLVYTDKVQKHAFSLTQIVDTPFNTSDFQPQYFIMDDEKDFTENVNALEEILLERFPLAVKA